MAFASRFQAAAAIVLPVLLAACGGSDGPIASAPLPPPIAPSAPSPTPTPTSPPVQPAQALAAPMMTAAPASPTASSASPSFKALSEQTTFPLLQTAVGLDYRRSPSFSGDFVTTSQGATLNINAATGRFGITLNNRDLGVEDVTVTSANQLVNGTYRPGAAIPGDRSLTTSLATLDYTAFGSWLIAAYPSGGYSWAEGGTFLGGYITPAQAVPASGTATFLGSVAGNYDESGQPPGDVAVLLGDVRVSTDFGSRSIAGLMTNLRLGSDWVRHGALNDIAFDAQYDPAANMFRGTTRVVTFPSGPSAFSADAAGQIGGMFFGPSAQEVGGVWTLSDSAHRLIGSFGARKN